MKSPNTVHKGKSLTQKSIQSSSHKGKRKSLTQDEGDEVEVSRSSPQIRSNIRCLHYLFKGNECVEIKAHHEPYLQKIPFYNLIKSFAKGSITLEDVQKSDECVVKIMEHYSAIHGGFLIRGELLKITKMDIKLIFGIKERCLHSVLMNYGNNTSTFKTRLFGGKNVNNAMVKKELFKAAKGETEQEKSDFACLLFLFIFSLLMQPLGKTLISKINLSIVDEIDHIQDFDWSEYICNILNDELAKPPSADKDLRRKLGCLIALPYWFCERTLSITSKRVNYVEFPRFMKWSLKTFSTEIKNLDLNDMDKSKFIIKDLTATPTERTKLLEYESPSLAQLSITPLHALPPSNVLCFPLLEEPQNKQIQLFEGEDLVEGLCSDEEAACSALAQLAVTTNSTLALLPSNGLSLPRLNVIEGHLKCSDNWISQDFVESHCSDDDAVLPTCPFIQPNFTGLEAIKPSETEEGTHQTANEENFTGSETCQELSTDCDYPHEFNRMVLQQLKTLTTDTCFMKELLSRNILLCTSNNSTDIEQLKKSVEELKNLIKSKDLVNSVTFEEMKTQNEKLEENARKLKNVIEEKDGRLNQWVAAFAIIKSKNDDLDLEVKNQALRFNKFQLASSKKEDEIQKVQEESSQWKSMALQWRTLYMKIRAKTKKVVNESTEAKCPALTQEYKQKCETKGEMITLERMKEEMKYWQEKAEKTNTDLTSKANVVVTATRSSKRGLKRPKVDDSEYDPKPRKPRRKPVKPTNSLGGSLIPYNNGK